MPHVLPARMLHVGPHDLHSRQLRGSSRHRRLLQPQPQEVHTLPAPLSCASAFFDSMVTVAANGVVCCRLALPSWACPCRSLPAVH
jgi:hypothetical protein